MAIKKIESTCPMADLSWPTPGPNNRLKARSKFAELVDLSNPEEPNKKNSSRNQRFFAALRDGGIWLS